MTIEESIAAVIAALLAPVQCEFRRVTAELEALRRALPPQLVTLTAAAKLLAPPSLHVTTKKTGAAL